MRETILGVVFLLGVIWSIIDWISFEKKKNTYSEDYSRLFRRHALLRTIVFAVVCLDLLLN